MLLTSDTDCSTKEELLLAPAVDIVNRRRQGNRQGRIIRAGTRLADQKAVWARKQSETGRNAAAGAEQMG